MLHTYAVHRLSPLHRLSPAFAFALCWCEQPGDVRADACGVIVPTFKAIQHGAVAQEVVVATVAPTTPIALAHVRIPPSICFAIARKVVAIAPPAAIHGRNCLRHNFGFFENRSNRDVGSFAIVCCFFLFGNCRD